MSQGERRLAAIMFTDIQGYTAMTQRNESEAMRVLQRYREVVRPLIEKYGGREVKTMGDGSLVEFSSALEASVCAVEMQRALFISNAPGSERVNVRIGIHVGDVIHESGDVYGDAVNIASRIEPLAKGGGVCISGQVYYQVRNKLPYGAVKMEPGDLKNISYPTEVYRLDLPWEKGSAKAEELNSRRLAVLPLDNISPDPNDEYFADGLTDELITRLSHVQGLEVIARTSVLRYKGGAKQVAVIGGELHVGSVLEGSVRKVGNRIRVTAQLIDANNEAHVWAETYDRNLDDIFAVQSDIAGKVAEALRLRLSDAGGGLPRPTSSSEAYNLWLRGKVTAWRLNKESILRACDYYEKALKLDPDFATCYASLAQAWLILGFFELVPTAEALSKAKGYAFKAIELDDRVAEGHVAMGRLLRMSDWKFEEADEELRLANELEPNLAVAHAFRAQGLVILGRREEATSEAKRALELDPFSVQTCQILGTVYLYDGRYDEAIELFERALEIDPDSPFPLGNLGLAYVQKGQVDRGLPLLEKANQVEGSNPSSMDDLAYAYSKVGRLEDVKRILTRLQEMRKESQRASAAIAGVYTTLGDYDRAIEWLERAFSEHSPYAPHVYNDFIFAPLRKDPRYLDLLRRMGLPTQAP